MIRFIKNILDIKNILGMKRDDIRTVSWDKPAGAIQVQVSFLGEALTVRFGSIVYPMTTNFHAFNTSPNPVTFYFDCTNVRSLTVDGNILIG